MESYEDAYARFMREHPDATNDDWCDSDALYDYFLEAERNGKLVTIETREWITQYVVE